jgi:hypothetical protein
MAGWARTASPSAESSWSAPSPESMGASIASRTPDSRATRACSMSRRGPPVRWGGVEGTAPGRSIGCIDRPLDRHHAAGEGGGFLVCKPVIVFNDVDARGGECPGQLRQVLDPATLGLERAASERPARCPKELPQPRQAQVRTAEAGQGAGRQVEVHELGLRLERAVAEQHVEQLSGLEAGGLQGERKGHPETGRAHPTRWPGPGPAPPGRRAGRGCRRRASPRSARSPGRSPGARCRGPRMQPGRSPESVSYQSLGNPRLHRTGQVGNPLRFVAPRREAFAREAHANPLGFCDCQRQESRTMSSSSSFACQPKSSRARLGSA